MADVIIAYEPIWAIGTGKTASAEQAQEMHAFIRKIIAERYSQEVADGISILYGGSVKPGNAEEIFAQPDVDGGLIGGASLKSRDFTDIIKACQSMDFVTIKVSCSQEFIDIIIAELFEVGFESFQEFEDGFDVDDYDGLGFDENWN